MKLSIRVCRPACLVAMLGLMAGSAGAAPGAWIQLPEAVSVLQRGSGSGDQLAVLAGAERSVVAEANAGRLAAAAALMDAYSSLVSPLADGDRRVRALEARVARALLAYGDSQRARDPRRAGRAWALAATYHADEPILDRLRTLLLPPADPQPGQEWRSVVDGVELVWLPPFRFPMGCTLGDSDCRLDERYVRWVEIPGFWMERTEVTNDRYLQCVRAGGCSVPVESAGFGDEQRAREPVVGVNWDQAWAFAAWAGRRLPAESEWERAARGKRDDWRYPWGNSRDRQAANVYGRGVNADPYQNAASVASFAATGWGLWDLSGNVWEWCEDTFHVSLIEAPRDGRPRTDPGRGRVLRGGSWRRTIELARVSTRVWQDEEYAADDVGFRCAMAPQVGAARDELVAMAQRMLPVLGEPGRDLDEADLEPADRRYLGRRAVTWLVLEGRAWDALPWAIGLLRRERDDPAALDLLGRLERELVADAEKTKAPGLERRIDRYRAQTAELGWMADRVASLEKRLLSALLSAGRALQGRAEPGAAAAKYRVALGLAPGEPKVLNLLRSALPTPGARRSWPSDGREMVWIPSGRTLMGRDREDRAASLDEQPAHTVWVRGFWMDRSEVTNDDYRRCVEAGACSPPDDSAAFDDPELGQHPVVWVDWYQARAYSEWAGKRLPTETEWEYAARAGQTNRYPWGPEWQDGAGNALGAKDGWVGSAPVGSFAANAWGLLDMGGNAWEWVEDVYHPDYRGAPRDGRAWLLVTGGAAEQERVKRGGSFANRPVKLRVSHRGHDDPEESNKSTGFRCASDE